MDYKVFTAGVFLVAAQVICAHFSGMLLPGQMKAQGVPLIAHFGAFWGDLFIITPLAAVIVHRYSGQWDEFDVRLAVVLGTIASAVMHFQYAFDTLPGAHGGNGRLSLAGVFHFVYMAGAIAILLLFYGFTRHVEPEFVWLAGLLLMAHVIVGTHTVLKILSPSWFPQMPVVDAQTFIVWAASALLLLAGSWHALR